MRSRPARIFLLAFTLVWFGAVVPGHQRGCITLASSQPPDDASKSPQVAVPSCHRPRTSSEAAQKKSPTKRAACAICCFASTIDTPPPADIVPRPTATVTVQEWDTPHSALLVPTHRFNARGPPA
jgi:hypothetical protein